MRHISRSVAALIGACSAAVAQCSMCRTAAAAQSARAAEALNLAVLILLVPATVLFSGLFVWSIRRRDPVSEDPVDGPDPADAGTFLEMK